MALINELLKEFNRKATLTYARTRTENNPANYLGPTLFPLNSVPELTFEYFKDLNRIPVMAHVQAYGAEASIASREGLEKVAGEIPPIKRKINMNERTLLALKREGLGDIDIVRNTIYNDLDNMIDAVLARVEKMRIDAVSTGKLVLNENGVIMTVDYGVPAGNKQTLSGTALWSDAVNSTPIDNIIAWTDIVVTASGIRPTRALTSNTVVANLIKSVQVRKMIYGDNGGSRAVTLSQLNELLRTLDLPLIGTYDVQVRVENADGTTTAQRLLDTKKFILLPPDTLGETLSGPTAEALLDPEVSAQEARGIYAIVYQEAEPPMVWTKAAATMIPTFPMADAVFQADVL